MYVDPSRGQQIPPSPLPPSGRFSQGLVGQVVSAIKSFVYAIFHNLTYFSRSGPSYLHTPSTPEPSFKTWPIGKEVTIRSDKSMNANSEDLQGKTKNEVLSAKPYTEVSKFLSEEIKDMTEADYKGEHFKIPFIYIKDLGRQPVYIPEVIGGEIEYKEIEREGTGDADKDTFQAMVNASEGDKYYINKEAIDTLLYLFGSQGFENLSRLLNQDIFADGVMRLAIDTPMKIGDDQVMPTQKNDTKKFIVEQTKEGGVSIKAFQEYECYLDGIVTHTIGFERTVVISADTLKTDWTTEKGKKPDLTVVDKYSPIVSERPKKQNP